MHNGSMTAWREIELAQAQTHICLLPAARGDVITAPFRRARHVCVRWAKQTRGRIKTLQRWWGHILITDQQDLPFSVLNAVAIRVAPQLAA